MRQQGNQQRGQEKRHREKDERLRSREVTEGPERAPHRAMFRAMGYDDEDFASPMVGVANPGRTSPRVTSTSTRSRARLSTPSTRRAECRSSSA